MILDKKPTDHKISETSPKLAQAKTSTDRYNYNFNLVGILKNEHRLLFDLYVQIIDFVDKEEFENVPSTLQDFCAILMVYLQKEEDQLNSFLVFQREQGITKSDTLKYAKNFKASLNDLKQKTQSMIQKNSNSKLTGDNKSDFLAELNAFGSILADRVRRVESTIYQDYLKL